MSRILVVGATSMIGQAVVRLFSKKFPDSMVIAVGRSAEKVSSFSHLNNVSPVLTDLTDETRVFELMKQHSDADVVIQNVAIYPWKPVDELTLNEWNQTLQTNLTAPFLITKELIPQMKKKRFGRFLYISSIAGESIGLSKMAAFTSTKAGLNGLMRTVALELAPYGITANSISPGKIYDPSTLSNEEIHEKTASIPLGRFQTPQDIAQLALFLASEEAKNITGQNYIVDGGQVIT